MTSVNTNAAALTALRTLQNTNSQLETTQSRISTGYKIGEAKDNAAYWAISTTLKSDNKALSTVKDALGLGSSTVDTAYQGLTKAKDVLDEIKSKLTAATQQGVDRNTIQNEITQLQAQLQSIASSSIFSGENWLSVDSSATGFSASKNVVASFNRSATGAVSIGTISVDTTNIALFDTNTAAGKDGILDTGVAMTGVTVGGSNTTLGKSAGGIVAGSAAVGRNTASGSTAYDGTKQLTWDNSADELHFTIAVDGGSSSTVYIRRGTVQTALNNSANSVTVTTATELAKVVQQGINDAGVTGVTVAVGADGKLKFTSAKTGSTSDVAVSSVAGTDNDTTAGTLSGAGAKVTTTDYVTGVDADVYEKATATMNVFQGPIQFVDATNDKILFSIDKDGAGSPTAVTINKATVSAALGTSDGKINTAADMQQVVIKALSNAGVSGVTVGSIVSGAVTFTSNTTGSTGAIAISAVSTSGFTTNGGTQMTMSVKDIDISSATLTARGAITGDQIKDVISAYVNVVQAAITKVTAAASNLGAVASRIDMQKSFVNTLMDTIDKGVGNLIDADMTEESTKLQALQVKQQLGTQALSIANQSAQNVLSLFQSSR